MQPYFQSSIGYITFCTENNFIYTVMETLEDVRFEVTCICRAALMSHGPDPGNTPNLLELRHCTRQAALWNAFLQILPV